MRELLYIPIVHTPEDLGNHLSEARKQYTARYGESKWEEHIKAVENFWTEIRNTLLNLPINYKKAKIYQDSLPVCNQELKIVQALAEDGNRNYKLLLELIQKGASIVGTEASELLLEERERLKNMGVVGSTNKYDDLMKRRDEYIACRIDSTLKDGETGLLFMGALHKVTDKLVDDIKIYKSVKNLKENH
ncbi:hypothetical protein GF312_08855 [Candidatus Poribacteria bacterium]|nr:hypothetical protein [Candidatus Poribacteria bacterium]